MGFDGEIRLLAVDKQTYVDVIPSLCLVSGFGRLDLPTWPVFYRAERSRNLRRTGMPLMFPNFSSVKDNLFTECGTHLAKHGLGAAMVWSVVGGEPKEGANSVCVCAESSPETLKQYPFQWRCEVEITAEPNRLVHSWRIVNLEGGKELPCSPGVHPYFFVPHTGVKKTVKLTPANFECAEYDWIDHIPDDNVPFNGQLTIDIPTCGSISITETPPPGASEKFYKRLQIWSESPDKPDFNFICFEPVRAGADGLNQEDLRINIPPQQNITMTLNIQFTPATPPPN